MKLFLTRICCERGVSFAPVSAAKKMFLRLSEILKIIFFGCTGNWPTIAIVTGHIGRSSFTILNAEIFTKQLCEIAYSTMPSFAYCIPISIAHLSMTHFHVALTRVVIAQFCELRASCKNRVGTTICHALRSNATSENSSHRWITTFLLKYCKQGLRISGYCNCLEKLLTVFQARLKRERERE